MAVGMPPPPVDIHHGLRHPVHGRGEIGVFMLPQSRREFLLSKRPSPDLTPEVLTLRSSPLPSLKEGEVLVEQHYLSIDPTNRIWMDEKPSYLPPIPLGSVMRGITGGKVISSRSSALAVGDLVVGMGGWSDYSVLSASDVNKIPPGIDLPNALSLFGHIGLTAYFGLTDIGHPKAGETVFVSGAAGATGSLVGQIAKNLGCKVVGSAGSDEKVTWLKEELGFDAAFNYRKTPKLAETLATLCPSGIDIYFDNVGGEMLDAALANLAMRGRVVLCGAISQYNEAVTHGPRHYLNLLMKRGRMEGFIVLDYMSRAPEALERLGSWLAQGKLKTRFDIVEGFENAPKALSKLFDGSNTGKLLVKIDHPTTK
jgi:NADPH-dependent curcumin reductase CurA